LRYLTTAFKFRARAQLGYIKIDDPASLEVVKKYDIPLEVDTLLLFQENAHTPVVRASMQALALNTLLDILESHQFLQLPRLSSQDIFDQLCPPESSKVRKRLCVVLITPQVC
jgi:DnaJ family protein C protein 16